MVSLSGLIPCNTPRMAVAGVRATASSSNALHLPISRIAVRYPFNGEMAYSPHSIPAHYAGVLSPHRGRHLHHAQRMIRQEILLETLLLVSIKRVKSGWLSAKIPVISSIYGPLLSVRLLSHARPNSLCPQLHCFYGAIWWLATCSKPPSSS